MQNTENRAAAPQATSTLSNSVRVAEAYKTIRVRLQLTLSSFARKTVAVTGVEPSAEKSITLANVGAALGQAQLRVLIADADLRRPAQHRIFKIPNRRGLSEVLCKTASAEDAVQKNVMPYVDVLTAGTLPPNPSELCSSPEMAAFLRRMEEHYDYVLLDTPPVGAVADSLALIPCVTGFVLVVRQGHTDCEELRGAAEMLRQHGAVLLGTVLTNVPEPDRRFGGRGYPYV